METTINITRPMLDEIKSRYEAAIKAKQDGFVTTDGHEFATAYAGYFLEYFCPKFGVSFSPVEGPFQAAYDLTKNPPEDVTDTLNQIHNDLNEQS